jgi:hypothetical protein
MRLTAELPKNGTSSSRQTAHSENPKNELTCRRGTYLLQQNSPDSRPENGGLPFEVWRRIADFIVRSRDDHASADMLEALRSARTLSMTSKMLGATVRDLGFDVGLYSVGNALNGLVGKAMKTVSGGGRNVLHELVIRVRPARTWLTPANREFFVDATRFLVDATNLARGKSSSASLADMTGMDREAFIADLVSDPDDPSMACELGEIGAELGCLDGAQRERVVDAAIRIRSEWCRTIALAGLGAGLRDLDEAQRQRIVDAVLGIVEERYRAIALAGMGDGLADLDDAQLKRIVDAVLGLGDEYDRARALVRLGVGLAVRLSGSDRRPYALAS